MSEIRDDGYFEMLENGHYFNSSDILSTFDKLKLKTDEYVVLGGANLVLRGLREATADIDMLVGFSTLDRLAGSEGAVTKRPPYDAELRGAANMTVHIERQGWVPVSATTSLLGRGYYPQTFEDAISKSEIVSGINCAALHEVLASKNALRRPKDVKDMMIIARHLGDTTMNIPEPIYEPVIDY